MSQLIGQNFKTRIPEFSDDASIEEALKVYHYGVDNYTVESIPDDSIEGNFRNLDIRVVSLESQISTLNDDNVKRISLTSSPNIITSQSTTTIPLVIRSIASQTSSLQQWQNNSSSIVASISTAGNFSTIGYISIGTLNIASSVATTVNVISPSHKGIVIKAATSQTANLQEWQSSSGSVMSWVSSNGDIYSRETEVQTMHPFLLMG